MSGSVPHLWRPSESRVAVLDSFVPVARGSSAAPPPPMNWAAKDPHDILDYQFDIKPAIIGNDGDSITTVSISIFPESVDGLVVESSIADGSRVVLWISGGEAGTVYTVTLSISTSNGRTVHRSVLLPVLGLSSPTTPGNAIELGADLVLTDQNGNPVLANP